MHAVNWVIKPSLKTEHRFLESDPSGQICPAHPSNLTTGNPDLPLNSWRFNKMAEDQGENLEYGHVILRCSTHDTEHARWVVEQARLGELDKEKVGAFLCEPDYDKRAFLLSLLDVEIQKEVSSWNKNKTLEVVSYLDEGDFLPWLYQEAVDGRWEKESVFAALTKEEVGGREVVVPRRKKALEISCSGPAGEDHGDTFGLYELVVDKEIKGSPVYRQAHSEEIPSRFNFFSTGLKMSGLLGRKEGVLT